MLCRADTGKCETLTKDHNLSRVQEYNRIKACGGRIEKDSFGYLRVGSELNSNLAMTRSIGDKPYKRFGVISEPEIKRLRVKGGNVAFAVIISDALTGILSDQEIVDIVFVSSNTR